MKLKESEDFSRAVAAKLQQLRLKKGISQNRLAEMAGISRAAVQHIEKGIRNPTIVVAHALASALGVSLSSILRQAEKD